MKRLFLLIIALVTAAVFSGCGGKHTVKDVKAGLDSSFESDMKITYDDSEFAGKIVRNGSGEWEVEFTMPETIAGVKLTFINRDVTASYKGLTFTVPKSALPVKSMLVNFINVVDELASSDKVECTAKDGILVMQGEIDQGKYDLNVDEKTCKILSFDMENSDVHMEFQNMVIKDKQDKLPEDVSQEPAQTQPVPST